MVKKMLMSAGLCVFTFFTSTPSLRCDGVSSDEKALLGIAAAVAVVVPTITLGGFVGLNAYRAERVLREEADYKGSYFWNFDPASDRLVARWAEDEWPTKDAISEYIQKSRSNRVDFEKRLEAALTGEYLLCLAGDDNALYNASLIMQNELGQLSKLAHQLYFASSLSAWATSRVKRLYERLERYVHRLEIISAILDEMLS